MRRLNETAGTPWEKLDAWTRLEIEFYWCRGTDRAALDHLDPLKNYASHIRPKPDGKPFKPRVLAG